MAQTARLTTDYVPHHGSGVFKEWSLKLGGYALSSLSAFGFVGAAIAKFRGEPMMKAQFAFFGLPPPFMYVVAIAESIGPVLLFTRYRLYGALILSIVAAGAAAEHLAHGQASHAPAAPILALLAWLSVFLHKASGNHKRNTVRACAYPCAFRPGERV